MPKALRPFEGGSTRSKQKIRFDLLPPSAVCAISRRLTLGAENHGERNWEEGGEEFRQATISHLIAHVIDYMQNGGRENTDAIICNAAFLCSIEERLPYPGHKEKRLRPAR